ncbi:ParA family protein, partial [Faecalimonas umbilicata]|uniref:ParA family protein n=1 Tax=Faecalimonas umbilicata TaxID=1912855 RepID=UPI00241C61BE
RNKREKDMKCYVIGNLKGGVGKTTTAVNLAYSMSRLGQHVLLVDMDPQTNLTPFFCKSKWKRTQILKQCFNIHIL